MFTCPSTFNIVPEVGDFYLFPNYLMHTVFPFKGTDEERRSISFNADIDERFIMFMENKFKKMFLGEKLELCSNESINWMV